MKKSMIVAIAAVVIAVALYPVGANAQMGPGYGSGYGMGPGMMGGGYGPGYGSGPGPGNAPGYGGGPGYGYGYGMGPGMMGGGYGMGPGMMGGYGYGMGPGMMGPGYGYGPQQYGPQYRPPYQQPQKPLDQDQAKQEVENYLSALRNPNLKVGKVEEKGGNYQVDIETKDGSLVDKMLVDKDTGRMRSAY